MPHYCVKCLKRNFLSGPFFNVLAKARFFGASNGNVLETYIDSKVNKPDVSALRQDLVARFPLFIAIAFLLCK